MGGGVEDQVADGDLPRAGDAGDAAKQRPRPRLKLGSIERLGDVIVRPGVEEGDFLFFGVASGEHEDRSAGPFADLATHVGARDIRESEIEDDQVRSLRCRAIDALSAGGCLDHLGTGGLKRVLHHPPDLQLVVDDKDGRRNRTVEGRRRPSFHACRRQTPASARSWKNSSAECSSSSRRRKSELLTR